MKKVLPIVTVVFMLLLASVFYFRPDLQHEDSAQGTTSSSYLTDAFTWDEAEQYLIKQKFADAVLPDESLLYRAEATDHFGAQCYVFYLAPTATVYVDGVAYEDEQPKNQPFLFSLPGGEQPEGNPGPPLNATHKYYVEIHGEK